MPVSPSPFPGEGTTAWMHDHMDVGGRTMPGAIVEEVAKQEPEPRMGVIIYWMLVATDSLGICSRRYSTFYIHVVVSSRDISHILWVVFTSMTAKNLNPEIY